MHSLMYFEIVVARQQAVYSAIQQHILRDALWDAAIHRDITAGLSPRESSRRISCIVVHFPRKKDDVEAEPGKLRKLGAVR